MQNFRALGATPPDPRASGGWVGPHCEFLATHQDIPPGVLAPLVSIIGHDCSPKSQTVL